MDSSLDLLPPRSWIPNGITAANIAAGFVAMLLAVDGRFEGAVYLLFVAILLDTMDGRMARLLGATSPIGQQLDSFSDTISFGAAPAFLVYLAVLEPMGPAGVAVALVYLLAGIYRLARFNILSDAHAKARRTMGVPIPIAAGYLMAVTRMRDDLSPGVAAAVVLAMAVLMTSRWRLPEFKGINLVTALMLVGLFNYVAVIVWPTWQTVIWWNVWNVVILLAARREDRLATLQPAAE